MRTNGQMDKETKDPRMCRASGEYSIFPARGLNNLNQDFVNNNNMYPLYQSTNGGILSSITTPEKKDTYGTIIKKNKKQVLPVVFTQMGCCSAKWAILFGLRKLKYHTQRLNKEPIREITIL